MTTIAYDGRYIAVDSRITTNSTFIVSDNREKFYENSDWVIFWCGCASEVDLYIDSFLNNKSVDKDSNVGLYAYEKITKKVFEVSYVEGKIWKGLLSDNRSTGYGADFATTAMDCGKSAFEAVKLAAKRDVHTGGLIRCFDTQTGKFIKVKQ